MTRPAPKNLPDTPLYLVYRYEMKHLFTYEVYKTGKNHLWVRAVHGPETAELRKRYFIADVAPFEYVETANFHTSKEAAFDAEAERLRAAADRLGEIYLDATRRLDKFMASRAEVLG